jgi:hypothetical protein
MAAILLAACTSIDCPVKNKVETTYALKKPNGKTDTLNTDTLSVWIHRINYKDGQRDSTLINRLCGSKGTSFAIVMSHILPEDSLFTLLKNNKGDQWLDTICIGKENSPHFESVDCRATYFHHITSVTTTKHGIDSIKINNREVNYDTTEHFFLYLKANR